MSALAISIRQPWAWLIVNAGKDVENRQWPTRYRGPLLIHAAKGMTNAEYDAAVEFAVDRCGVLESWIPRRERLERGGIVGAARLVGCIEGRFESPWMVGRYGFVLADARPLDFQPCKGALGLFRPAIEVATA